MLTLPRGLVDLASLALMMIARINTAEATTTARGYKVPLELGSSAIKVFFWDGVPYV